MLLVNKFTIFVGGTERDILLKLYLVWCRVFSLQVSADKLDSITAFPKFFSQPSYTKLASYRRAIFQALEVSVNM